MMSRSTIEHKKKAPALLNFAVITISTSRYEKAMRMEAVEDESGELSAAMLSAAGQKVVRTALVSDNQGLIKKSLKKALDMPNVDAVITCGGTGITHTDVTIETINPLLEKELPGFGELFRRFSYEEIGSAAIITRATAGLIKGKAVFCLPGSPQAVAMALNRLIIPEVGHIIKHARE